MNAKYGSLSFEEANSFFRNKIDMPSERWADVWQAQHNTAFSVAGATKKELIADFRQMVDSAISEGKSLKWFQSNFKQVAKKHGWDFNGEAKWRANIIYSTNVRQAYNAGRYEQLQNFEYWRYAHGDSLSPRAAHKSRDGTILPKSSSFWDIWFPQNGWGCKCKVFGESKRSLARKGLTPSGEPTIERREWIDKATGEAHQVPVGIDPGFDYAPGKVDAAQRIKKIEALKPTLEERLKPKVIPSAFSTVKTVGHNGLESITQELLSGAAAAPMKSLSAFLDKHQTKTVVINSRQMSYSKASRTIGPDVADYLGVNPLLGVSQFALKKKDKPEGFTSQHFNHVVIKASGAHNLNRVDVNAMLSGIKTMFKDGLNESKTGVKTRKWALSTLATGHYNDDASRYLTWLHEIGHQVHYKAGIPDRPTNDFITLYSNANKREWFAETFVFYMLANDDMHAMWPQVAQWFDDAMKKALL